MPKKNNKLTIMVSSTVYGIEELLDRIYTLLTAFGYEVWMSHKGTMPVFSNKSAFENCIRAVEKCDLFLCLITPHYGSGVDGDGLSITHQELKKAIELKKPRWLLAHDYVVFSRKLLNDLNFKGQKARDRLNLKRKASSLSDLRLIDMYEDAILSQHPLRDRQGNWVQKFQTNEDAFLFATAQFSRYQEVEAFIKENLSDPSTINTLIEQKGEQP
jgi:nucleoside 2-deoxyribosyltransferase